MINKRNAQNDRNNRPLIKITNLKKIYRAGTPEEVQALRGINLSIQQGEFIAIMGASGSGKSTLLNILGCMDKATSGAIRIGEKDITEVPQRKLGPIRKNMIGFVFQDVYLLDSLTALENVLAPLIPYGIRRENKVRAKELLTKAGLGERLKHRPNEMSGGQKQRVAICRALINNPSLILADEPTGNLDSKLGAEIMDLLKEINKEQKTTVIVVSHDPRVTGYTSRIIELEDGQIIRDAA